MTPELTANFFKVEPVLERAILTHFGYGGGYWRVTLANPAEAMRSSTDKPSVLLVEPTLSKGSERRDSVNCFVVGRQEAGEISIEPNFESQIGRRIAGGGAGMIRITARRIGEGQTTETLVTFNNDFQGLDFPGFKKVVVQRGRELVEAKNGDSLRVSGTVVILPSEEDGVFVCPVDLPAQDGVEPLRLR